MRILYHHRTQAEDGQAVHIRSLIRAFESLGHEVWEVGLVRRRCTQYDREKRQMRGKVEARARIATRTSWEVVAANNTVLQL